MTDNFFWFETGKASGEDNRSYYFGKPREVLALEDAADLEDYFRHLQLLSKRYYLAGFFSYEFGYLLEDKLSPGPKVSFPYAWFGVFDRREVAKKREAGSGRWEAGGGKREAGYGIRGLKLDVSYGEYAKNIAKIKRHLAAGDIYQANYTIKYKFGFHGSAQGLYEELKRKQRANYNVLAQCGKHTIISASPELFFAIDKGRIKVRPMKGTVARGRYPGEDACNRQFLVNDEKNRAENLMIVDLLRNDLGRISKAGSVKTKKMFEVEQYPTVHQMTSSIESRLKPNTSIFDLVKAVFPSGSVTGAPKIRCMQILRGLEKEERKIYTGAIGFFSPDGSAKFNVAIRTVLLEGGKAEMGIGGGIVADSRAADEYAEAKLKGTFLTGALRPDFKLIEALLYDNGLKRLERHMARLKESADYFGFRPPPALISKALKLYAAKLGKGRYKLRLLVGEQGDFAMSHEKRGAPEKEYSIGISKHKTNSSDPFLYHKTTNRELYERERMKAAKKGLFDMLFFNQRAELTEGARTNVYIEEKGRLYTPPLECGLLNGIVRRGLVKKGTVVQKVMKRKDLLDADAVYISSAIIGFRRAIVAHGTQNTAQGGRKKGR